MPLKAQWFQILLALGDRDLNGSDIMKEVLERTDGAMHLWPGQLYGSLKQLVAKGYVIETEVPDDAAYGGGRPRYYSIANDGRQILSEEVDRLAKFVEAARAKNLMGKA